MACPKHASVIAASAATLWLVVMVLFLFPSLTGRTVPERASPRWTECDPTPCAPECATQLLAILRALTEAAAELGLSKEYFAMAGTLLGVVRDGAIIPWTADVDLAISLDFSTMLRTGLLTKLLHDRYDLVVFYERPWRVCKRNAAGKHHVPRTTDDHVMNAIAYADLYETGVAFEPLPAVNTITILGGPCNPLERDLLLPLDPFPLCVRNTTVCLPTPARTLHYLDYTYGPTWPAPPPVDQRDRHGIQTHFCGGRKEAPMPWPVIVIGVAIAAFTFCYPNPVRKKLQQWID